MRLDKYLADHNVGSRSEVKLLIRKGKVTVNEEIVKTPEFQIMESDIVSANNVLVYGKKFYYYMFHKPAGFVSAVRDDVNPTVMEFFKGCDRFDELFPVGRLDKDTEGLLIITNDGDFSHNLTSPKKHVDKTYYFESDLPLHPQATEQMAQGLTLKDSMLCKPAKLVLEDTNKGCLTIREGAYHQIKRMIAACEGHVTYLKRLSIGALQLDSSLDKGSFRELTEDEKCQAICQSVKKI